MSQGIDEDSIPKVGHRGSLTSVPGIYTSLPVNQRSKAFLAQDDEKDRDDCKEEGVVDLLKLWGTLKICSVVVLRNISPEYSGLLQKLLLVEKELIGK